MPTTNPEDAGGYVPRIIRVPAADLTHPERWVYADEPLRPEYPPLPPPGVRLAWAAFVIAAAFLLTLIVGLLLRMAS